MIISEVLISQFFLGFRFAGARRGLVFCLSEERRPLMEVIMEGEHEYRFPDGYSCVWILHCLAGAILYRWGERHG